MINFLKKEIQILCACALLFFIGLSKITSDTHSTDLVLLGMLGYPASVLLRLAVWSFKKGRND